MELLPSVSSGISLELMDEPDHEPTADGGLLSVIETEIIPRLVMAHRSEVERSTWCSGSRTPPGEAEISSFASIAARHDLAGALSFVERLCREGLSLESALLDLVAPAARLLGEQWKADERSFTEVSSGLGTLQQVVHVLGPSFAVSLPHRGLVLLVAAPGEQHTLGLYLVGEFLRRAGWGVKVDPAMSEEEVVSFLASEWVEMLGITVSGNELIPSVKHLIAAAREASRNPHMAVVLGGSSDLEVDEGTGVTLRVRDPNEAVQFLDHHVAPRSGTN